MPRPALLLAITLLVLFGLSRAHIDITSPTVGVRPLPDDNTTPCASLSPTSPRYQLPQATTPLSISVYSSDTHSGGNVSLVLGFGTNPTVYSVPGPWTIITPSNSSATLVFNVPYQPASGVYGTIQLYFSGGGNYQCIDLTWAAPTTTPPPTSASPYVPWPRGVIGRTLNTDRTAAYWLFTSPNTTQKLCSWEYATLWNTYAAWFNTAAGTYDALVQSPVDSSLTINHTLVGSISFGLCPHQDTSTKFSASADFHTRSYLRVVPSTVAGQIIIVYYCDHCTQPTQVISVNTTTGAPQTLGSIEHVSAAAGTYDWYNGTTVVADSSAKEVWFFDSNFQPYGVSNMTGQVDSFYFARICPSRKLVYVLGIKNLLASTLYSIDMTTGKMASLTIGANPLTQFTTFPAFSVSVDVTNNLIWGVYSISSYTFGVFSINIATGAVQASPVGNLDPAGLILHV